MKVFELLSDRSKWTTQAYARSLFATPVSALDPDAVCWCLSGAIVKCYDDAKRSPEIHRRVSNKLPKGCTITNFNDLSPYEEVLAFAKELDI